MFYVNEYETNLGYGGPEEGGWWYSVGKFVTNHGEFDTVEEAGKAVQALGGYIAEAREGRYEPSSVLCNGWPILRVERHPGRDFPQEIPRYE